MQQMKKAPKPRKPGCFFSSSLDLSASRWVSSFEQIVEEVDHVGEIDHSIATGVSRFQRTGSIIAFEQVLNFEPGQQPITETTRIIAAKDENTAVPEPVLTAE